MSMVEAIEAVRVKASALPGYRVQLGQWIDGLPTDRFIVIRPFGGDQGDNVRRPRISLMFIGAQNSSALLALADVETFIASVQQDSGGVALLRTDEPAFYSTAEQRPVYELIVSTITSL